MKRLFLLCICATLSGCSWTHYFLLRNDTQETLEIAYQLNLSLEEYNMFDKHIKVFHKKVKDSDYYNLEGEDVKHYFNLDKSILKVWLPADHVLVMMKIRNSRFLHYSQYPQFNLGILEIRSDSLSMIIKPDELKKHLSINRRFKVVISIKPEDLSCNKPYF